MNKTIFAFIIFLNGQIAISQLPNNIPKKQGNIFPIIANGIIRDYLDKENNSAVSRDSIVERQLSLLADGNYSVVSVNFTPGDDDRHYRDYVDNIIQVAKEKGLSLLIYDGRYYMGFPYFTPAEMIKEYPYPEVMGFFIDEPTPKELPRAATWSRYFNRLPKKTVGTRNSPILYVNLYGYHAIGDLKYEEYVESWIRTGEPKVLSFDNYSLWDNERAQKSGAALAVDLTNDYFVNLQMFSELSDQNNIPFWTWLQIHRHASEYSRRFYKRATVADLRFQIYSALAYGAKGLLYYNYWNPIESLNNQWNEENGLIGYDGIPTELYYEAKQLNGMIQSIGDLVLELECEGVYHATNWVWLPEKKEYQKDWDPLYDKKGRSTFSKYGMKLSSWNTEINLPPVYLSKKIIYSIENINGMAGQFRHKKTGDRYIMVVNKNRHSRQKIEFTIVADVQSVSRYRSIIDVTNNKVYSGTNHENPNRLSFISDLNAGEGAIFKLLTF